MDWRAQYGTQHSSCVSPVLSRRDLTCWKWPNAAQKAVDLLRCKVSLLAHVQLVHQNTRGRFRRPALQPAGLQFVWVYRCIIFQTLFCHFLPIHLVLWRTSVFQECKHGSFLPQQLSSSCRLENLTVSASSASPWRHGLNVSLALLMVKITTKLYSVLSVHKRTFFAITWWHVSLIKVGIKGGQKLI